MAIQIFLALSILVWDNDWKNCQKAFDCTVVEDFCNSWIAVNKNKPIIECAVFERFPKPDPVCEQGKCNTIYDIKPESKK